MDTVGKIHSFQSLGAVDGPGLRCVVFMQGCPLRCIYCHNPDAQGFAGGEEYTPEKMAQKILRYKPYIKDGGVTVSGGEPLMQPDFVRELFKILKQNKYIYLLHLYFIKIRQVHGCIKNRCGILNGG